MGRESGSISPAQFVLLLHSIPHVGEKTLSRLLRLNAQQRLSPEACLALHPDEWKRHYEMRPGAVAYLETHKDKVYSCCREGDCEP